MHRGWPTFDVSQLKIGPAPVWLCATFARSGNVTTDNLPWLTSQFSQAFYASEVRLRKVRTAWRHAIIATISEITIPRANNLADTGQKDIHAYNCKKMILDNSAREGIWTRLQQFRKLSFRKPCVRLLFGDFRLFEIWFWRLDGKTGTRQAWRIHMSKSWINFLYRCCAHFVLLKYT